MKPSVLIVLSLMLNLRFAATQKDNSNEVKKSKLGYQTPDRVRLAKLKLILL